MNKATNVIYHDKAASFGLGSSAGSVAQTTAADDSVNRAGGIQHLIARTKFFHSGARLDTKKRAA